MDKSLPHKLRSFLAEEEKLAENRLEGLNNFLETNQFNDAANIPLHITDTLNLLRQNAEEDLSNILHMKSIFPSSLNKISIIDVKTSKPKQSPVKAVKAIFSDSTAVLGVVEDVEAAVAVTDDLFLMEGVDISTQPRSSRRSTFSDEEKFDSELDEGIHMPKKLDKKAPEVAASLPVGIPWPMDQLSAVPYAKEMDRQVEDKPMDIAASIQAMAKSVHTSSIFGDNTFGDLPRPRLNTFTGK